LIRIWQKNIDSRYFYGTIVAHAANHDITF